MFSLSEFENQQKKEEHLKIIKNKLEELTNIIPELKAISVEVNINNAEDYDFLLIADVDNMQDLEAYAKHPAHISIVKEFIAPYKRARACVDFEI